MTSIAIVGAGQAGATLAIALRQQGWRGPVTLFGAEMHAPYERPALSKELLRGVMQPQQLMVQPAEQYRAHDIRLSLGASVEAILPDEGRLYCADGTSHAYTHLVLATGAAPRGVPTLEPDGVNVRVFRTLDDAQALASRVRPGQRIAIVGAGLIGVELASALSEAGARITVIDTASRPMANVLVPELGLALERLLVERGVAFHWGTTVVREGASDQPLRLRLDKGGTLLADTVLVCAGTLANIGLARSAGLATRSGILVDAQGKTSHPAVFAVGDCAEFFHPLYGRHLRLEQFQHAAGQAMALAALLCGAGYAYASVPWSWTEVCGRKLALMGLFERNDIVHWAGPPDEMGSVALTGQGDRVTGAQGFISPRTAHRIRHALQSGKTMDELIALCEPMATSA